MPWSEKQIRLFRAAAHNPAFARKVGIKQSDARRMSKEGVRRHCGGLVHGYSDGGEVERESPLEEIGLGGGLALALALHPKSRRLMKRAANKTVKHTGRLLKHPVVATEAVSKIPLPEGKSDELYDLVRGGIDHPYASLPVLKRQGAWLGDEGMQYNPLYEQELPRFFGPLSKNREALKYAAMLGEGLDQQGVPLTRAMKLPFDVPEDANALLTDKLSSGALRRLAEAMGPQTVVSHQPSGEALIFSLGDDPVLSLRDKVQKAIAGARPRFAASDPGIDRLVVTADDWGAPNVMRKDILGR